MLKLYTALHPVNPPDSAEMLVKKCPLFFQVLNLFLALLLSSFGGDALNSGGGEDPEKPKKSRLQRLIEWTKKKRKKKSANTVISHYVKSVQIRSFFLVRRQENTDQKKLRIWTFFMHCQKRLFWKISINFSKK